MKAPVSVDVLTTSRLFASSWKLSLPHRQRPYAWGIEQVSRLLADLLAICRKPEASRYLLLGRVLLVDGGGPDDRLIVDGHQRLLTLTILCAVLRDLDIGEVSRRRLTDMLSLPASDPAAARFRLTPQAMLSRVLSGLVQTPGSTTIENVEDVAALSESESNVVGNRDYLRTQLTRPDITADLRERLVSVLCDACWLIVQQMSDEDEAWRYLESEEATGLDFSHTDRAKTSILSDMPLDNREACTSLWESWHHQLGAEDTLALLTHVRTLKLRERSEVPVEVELGNRYLSEGRGRAFFEEELAPRAKLLLALRRREVGSGGQRDEIAVALRHLTWLERQLWVPPVMHWIEQRGADDPTTGLFCRRLERIVWIMRIASADPTVREMRMLSVLTDIDGGRGVDSLNSLNVDRGMLSAAVAGMRDKGFTRRRFCGPVLRRLAVIAGDDPGPTERLALTIEHVLPRNPAAGSTWLRIFINRQRVHAYVNRLGNLTLLTKAENNRAGSEPYPIKQAVLASSTVALARLCARVPDWTPKAIEERTEAMIATLLAAWDLTP